MAYVVLSRREYAHRWENIAGIALGPFWISALSLIPFLINLGIMLFVALKVARTKLNFSFLLFLLVLSAWQLTESLGRTFFTAETASLFVRILLYPMLFIPISGTLFILRLTG